MGDEQHKCMAILKISHSCLWMSLHMKLCLTYLHHGCIFFGRGWTASLLHLFSWSPCVWLPAAAAAAALACIQVDSISLRDLDLFQATYLLLFYSLLFLICLHFNIILFPPVIDTPHPQPCRTRPITRIITIKAKQWIKEMISPQWQMPWQGWVPPRPSQPCPAAPAPSPVFMTASCSARAARRPSRGWRWARVWMHTALPQCKAARCSSLYADTSSVGSKHLAQNIQCSERANKAISCASIFVSFYLIDASLWI